MNITIQIDTQLLMSITDMLVSNLQNCHQATVDPTMEPGATILVLEKILRDNGFDPKIPWKKHTKHEIIKNIRSIHEQWLDGVSEDEHMSPLQTQSVEYLKTLEDKLLNARRLIATGLRGGETPLSEVYNDALLILNELV